jgi:xanthine dehydrogenase accessory factor
VLAIEGSAPRKVGTQIAISAGAHCGSLSGGCLDAAVHAEARAAMLAGKNVRLQLGENSDILDLRLPCGSTLLLQIDAALSPYVGHEIRAARAARRVVSLAWNQPEMGAQLQTKTVANYTHRYLPALQLHVIGAEPMLSIFLNIARAAGAHTYAYSAKINQPDHTFLPWPASLQDAKPHLALDQYSAALTLFHEHEFELPFLSAALQSKAFWVGSMGSRKAQATRLEALHQLGVTADLCAKLRGPVGGQVGRNLDKTPELIALAAVLDILNSYEQLS